MLKNNGILRISKKTKKIKVKRGEFLLSMYVPDEIQENQWQLFLITKDEKKTLDRVKRLIKIFNMINNKNETRSFCMNYVINLPCELSEGDSTYTADKLSKIEKLNEYLNIVEKEDVFTVLVQLFTEPEWNLNLEDVLKFIKGEKEIVVHVPKSVSIKEFEKNITKFVKLN